MIASAALLVGAVACATWDDAPTATRRLDRLWSARPRGRGSPSGSSVVGLAGRRRAACGVAGLGVALVAGGAAGIVVGVLVAAALDAVLSRLEPADVRRRRLATLADLPVALDLMAACLCAGGPVGDAVSVVAEVVGGPLGDDLALTAARLSSGLAPAEAWQTLTTGSAHPAVARAARAIALAQVRGARLADRLGEIATEAREVADSSALEAARAVAVSAIAPLAMCFLPAFFVLGVVPMLVGLAGQVL